MSLFEPTRPELVHSIDQLCRRLNEQVSRLIVIEATLGEESGLAISLQMLSSAIAEVVTQLEADGESEAG